jgi:hypothetical protein
MTPPRTARQLLAGLRTAMQSYDALFNETNSQIATLRSRLGNTDDLESQLGSGPV